MSSALLTTGCQGDRILVEVLTSKVQLRVHVRHLPQIHATLSGRKDQRSCPQHKGHNSKNM